MAIGIGADTNMDIDLGMAVSTNWGVLQKGFSRAPLKALGFT